MSYHSHSLLLVVLVALTLTANGCVSQRIATAFTNAPNGGRDTVDPERDGPELYDARGQVDVPGPPPVTLAYWVMEPGAGRVERITSTPKSAPNHAPAGWRVFDAKPSKKSDPPSFIRTAREPMAFGDSPENRPTAKATVVMLQGWGTQVRTGDYLLHLAATLADQGCRVICPDLRGHGDSTGEFVTSGFREVEDLSALLDDFDRRGLLQGPVGVIGHSYGGGIAIQFAVHEPRVERVFALSPLADIRPAMLPGIQAFLKSQRPIQWTLYLQWMVHQKAIDEAQRLMGERTGADLAINNALHQIPHVDVPILILQGDNDIATPLAGAEKLREANPQQVELMVFAGAGHTSYLRDDFDEVEPRLRGWAEQLMTNKSPVPSISQTDR